MFVRYPLIANVTGPRVVAHANARFNNVNHRFDHVDQQFGQVINQVNQNFNDINQVNQNFNDINQSFDHVNHWLNNIDQRLNHVDDQLGGLRAQTLQITHHLQQMSTMIIHTQNTQIILTNRTVGVEKGLRPRLKSVPGLGVNLALERVGVAHAAPEDLLEQQAKLAAGDDVPAPELGQASPFWLWDKPTDEYSADHILRLITFYNEDFRIVAMDGLPARTAKFRLWMTSL